MISDLEKVQHILNELLQQAADRGAGRILVEITDMAEETRVVVQDDGKRHSQVEQQELLSQLNSGRRDELETYYGVLLGESHAGNGMNMIGMMVDRAELLVSDSLGNRLTVFRRKQGGK